MNHREIATAIAALMLASCTGTGAVTDRGNAETQAEPAPVQAPATYVFDASAETIKADMTYLSSDDLQGREAGTAGYDTAAAYVADRFAAMGLKPAGTEGYMQPVPFRRAYRIVDGLDLAITAPDGSAVPLERGVDYEQFPELSGEDQTITGELVFAGFGVVAPDIGRNDLEGLDLDGKIAVVLSGSPRGIQTEERAYYRSQRSKELSDRGAIGVISVTHPERESVFPFTRLVGMRYGDQARLGWLRPGGDLFTRAPNLKGSAFMSMEGARKVFAAAGMDYDAIIETAESEGGPTESRPMGLTATIQSAALHDDMRSPNVVAMLEGSDPELKDEFIVLTAHLDHIGVNPSFSGDRINNGALDNAAGVSTMLEAARILAEGPAPKRSVLFIALTAEEKGLLGAQYFTEYPTVPKEAIVGNVNLDMPILTHEFVDVIVYGGTRSTMLPAIETAAAAMDVAISEDREPEQGTFTRSDHFRFVEAGVPSVFLVTGYENGGVEAKAEHRAKTYHMPADQIDNPKLDFDAGAKFAELNARVAVTLANADERPLWQQGDFFARKFDGPMAE